MTLRMLIVIAALLSAGGLGFFLGRPHSVAQQEVVTEVRPSASVITALRHLARLEGAQFHMERVVDVREKQSRYLGLVEVEDALLLVASGEVTAGVDLSELSDVNVQTFAEQTEVTVHLPRARVLSSKIDNDKTYVHTRSTDLLAKQQIHLEAKARKTAEEGFVAAALDAGLLRVAEASIERTVISLLFSLGFDKVEVVFDRPGSSR